jgi:hypothetical protein
MHSTPAAQDSHCPRPGIFRDGPTVTWLLMLCSARHGLLLLRRNLIVGCENRAATIAHVMLIVLSSIKCRQTVNATGDHTP